MSSQTIIASSRRGRRVSALPTRASRETSKLAASRGGKIEADARQQTRRPAILKVDRRGHKRSSATPIDDEGAPPPDVRPSTPSSLDHSPPPPSKRRAKRPTQALRRQPSPPAMALADPTLDAAGGDEDDNEGIVADDHVYTSPEAPVPSAHADEGVENEDRPSLVEIKKAGWEAIARNVPSFRAQSARASDPYAMLWSDFHTCPSACQGWGARTDLTVESVNAALDDRQLRLTHGLLPLSSLSRAIVPYRPRGGLVNVPAAAQEPGLAHVRPFEARGDIRLRTTTFQELERRSADVTCVANYVRLLSEAMASILDVDVRSPQQKEDFVTLSDALQLATTDLLLGSVASQTSLLLLRRAHMLQTAHMPPPLREKCLRAPVSMDTTFPPTLQRELDEYREHRPWSAPQQPRRDKQPFRRPASQGSRREQWSQPPRSQAGDNFPSRRAHSWSQTNRGRGRGRGQRRPSAMQGGAYRGPRGGNFPA